MSSGRFSINSTIESASMTVAAPSSVASSFEHVVLEDMSWDFYERLLREIGSRQIRVTYDDGRMEIMSPLPKHERWGAWIGRLVELMLFEVKASDPLIISVAVLVIAAAGAIAAVLPARRAIRIDPMEVLRNDG